MKTPSFLPWGNDRTVFKQVPCWKGIWGIFETAQVFHIVGYSRKYGEQNHLCFDNHWCIFWVQRSVMHFSNGITHNRTFHSDLCSRFPLCILNCLTSEWKPIPVTIVSKDFFSKLWLLRRLLTDTSPASLTQSNTLWCPLTQFIIITPFSSFFLSHLCPDHEVTPDPVGPWG